MTVEEVTAAIRADAKCRPTINAINRSFVGWKKTNQRDPRCFAPLESFLQVIVYQVGGMFPEIPDVAIREAAILAAIEQECDGALEDDMRVIRDAVHSEVGWWRQKRWFGQL